MDVQFSTGIDVDVSCQVVAMDITTVSGIEQDISTDYAQSRQNTLRKSRWWSTGWWCRHRRWLNSWNINRCQSLVFIATEMKNWTICVIFQWKDSWLIGKFCLPNVGQENFPDNHNQIIIARMRNCKRLLGDFWSNWIYEGISRSFQLVTPQNYFP